MDPTNDSSKTIERKKFVRKSNRQTKNRRDKNKLETKGSRQNHRYRMIVEDVVVYNFLARNSDSQGVKRKLPSIDEEWEELPYTSPYPRKLKSHHHPAGNFSAISNRPNILENKHPASLEMYESSNDSSNNYGDVDTLTSDVLPIWNNSGEENSEHSSNGIDSSSECDSTEVAGVEIVTIDEMIEFEGNDFELDKEPICFEIRKLCAVVGTEQLMSEEDSNHGEEKITEDVPPFKNDSGDVTCGDDEDFISKTFKEAEREHIDRYCTLLKCSECWKVENCKEQWNEDFQIEQFNFGRCFKCRQKVYAMNDCPYHSNKGTVVA